MNDKQKVLCDILDIVVGCCTFDVYGKPSITKEDVLGKSRKSNLVMTRCVLSHIVLSAGYSIETLAMLLGRTEVAVRSMIKQGHNLLDTSRAYRVAYTQAYTMCREKGLI